MPAHSTTRSIGAVVRPCGWHSVATKRAYNDHGDVGGAVRFFPHQNEIRPALSVYVSEPVETDAIPVAHFFNIGEDEFKKAAKARLKALQH